jgi:hypothetical protein
MSEIDDLTPEEQTQLEENKKVNDILPDIKAAVEAREKYIKEEMAKGVSEAAARDRYFNNFSMMLPCNDDNQPGFGASYRRIFRTLRQENLTFEEIVTNENERKPMSRRKLKQTPLQFWERIDNLLVQHGIDLEHVRELNEKALTKDELHLLCTPVFDELRTMYTRTDLDR